MSQLRIPAVYMRGGTSKGVFFLANDLPSDPQHRDRILRRVIGSPDSYGKHVDGMGGAMFPTGNTTDWLDVPGVGRIEATLIDAGLPTVFVEARSLGFKGNELQADVNSFPDLLERAEKVRVVGAAAMGLVATPGSHTPKIAFVACRLDYTASDGRPVKAMDIDLLARIFSMGQLHHAVTGTGAVAIAAATAVPGTIPHRLVKKGDDGRVRFGHPSGTLSVGAEAARIDGEWVVSKALMSRSARRLMAGWVFAPQS